MDSQFNELTRSYHDNFLEYKVTGDPKYKTAYESAQTGIQSILATTQAEVTKQKNEIAAFYASNPEESLNALRADSRELKSNLIAEDDEFTAANLREQPIVDMPSLTSQYISLGVLGALLIVLLTL